MIWSWHLCKSFVWEQLQSDMHVEFLFIIISFSFTRIALYFLYSDQSTLQYSCYLLGVQDVFCSNAVDTELLCSQWFLSPHDFSLDTEGGERDSGIMTSPPSKWTGQTGAIHVDHRAHCNKAFVWGSALLQGTQPNWGDEQCFPSKDTPPRYQRNENSRSVTWSETTSLWNAQRRWRLGRKWYHRHWLIKAMHFLQTGACYSGYGSHCSMLHTNTQGTRFTKPRY